MNAVITSLVFLSLVGLGYSWKYPRNADQTLWAFRTCQRRESDVNLLKKWANWQLPNDDKTHCYVKCVWTHLGLYSKNKMSLRVDKIKKQFSSRGVAIPKDLKSMEGETDGSCKAIYDKTISFFNNNVADLRTAFYGTIEESNKWYAQNPDAKPKGTKISKFCKAENREQGESNCKHACSAYYYRLVDEDFEPIYFRLLEIKGFSNKDIDECIKQASGRQGCQRSDALYDCLKNKKSAALEAALQILDDQSARTY
uniref:SP28b n=1 Tax=Phlebotomus papatasi TaxID=29031 RepID=M1JB43_PHLPP|nr:SP28b [Phlebotomus papatasi]